MCEHELLYLASRSPRRRELLAQLGISPCLVDIEIDETVSGAEDAEHYTHRLAIAKANVGWDKLCHSGQRLGPVLAADTVVSLHNELYGKPADPDEAFAMLKKFSGCTHQVVTTVVLKNDARVEYRTSVSDVTFRTLSEKTIERYLALGEFNDKAGAYAIQGRAGAFVERISGSFTGVVGLPLFETATLLKAFGYAML